MQKKSHEPIATDSTKNLQFLDMNSASYSIYIISAKSLEAKRKRNFYVIPEYVNSKLISDRS